MPYSEWEGKQWIAERYLVLCALGRVGAVCDLGAGAGIYSDLLRALRPQVHWTAVEVWGPYVEKFRLEDKYDTVVVSDLRYLDYAKIRRPDCVFAGDVLEHMTQDDALGVLDTLLGLAQAIFVSIPIIDYPQGDALDNPYEAHVESAYSHARLLDRLPCVYDFSVGEKIGTYLLSKNAAACRVLDSWGWEKKARANGEPNP